MKSKRFAQRAVRPASVIATVGLVGFAAFQTALALGAPWGKAAWGGSEATLETGLRVASGAAALVLIAATWVVLGRAGFRRAGRDGRLFRWGTWAIALVLALGGLGNLASSSNWERFLNGPAALLIAAACLIVARGAPAETSPAADPDRADAPRSRAPRLVHRPTRRTPPRPTV
jgi:hypothetical protein